METGKMRKLFFILLTILLIGGICGTADGQGTEVITFSEFPLGTYITTQYSDRGIIFGGDSPFIWTDGAHPTSPVLSGEPLFEGAIEGVFVNPSDGVTPITVSSFSMDAGYFNDIGSTRIEWFDKNNDKMGEQSNSSYGIEHFDIEGAGIARWRFAIISTETAGYTIDNVSINEFYFEPQGLVHNITQDTWYDVIQEAIGDANNGDELVAYPWHYCESVNFGEKVVTLRSTDPEDPEVVAATIIDACGDWYTIEAGEGFELNGFTVTGGLYSCMNLYCSCGTIKNCVIEGNGGHGIYQCYCGTPPSSCLVVEDCIIRNNEQGIHTDYSSAAIEGCQIYGNDEEGIKAGPYSSITMSDNSVYDNGGDGVVIRSSSTATVKNNHVYNNYYGIYTEEDSNSTINNNQIYDNSVGIKAAVDSIVTVQNNMIYNNVWGMWAESGSVETITNNTIVKNNAGIIASSSANPTVNNCIFVNEYVDATNCSPTYSRVSDCNDVNEANHNICDDPCFVDADSNDFHLLQNSPCIDIGDPNGDYDGQVDIDGQPRVLGEGVVDIGADEFFTGGLVHNITQNTWYYTIQSAIGDANSGDELAAYPWRYLGGIHNFSNLTIRSIDPEDPCVVAATIIDADGDWYVVESMGPNSVLNGLTMTGGLYSCMNLYCSCGTIKNCVLEDNGGYGIYQCECGSPIPAPCLVVEDCIIRNNEQGIYTDYSSAAIEGCQIYGNDEEGVEAGPYSSITMSDNIIYGNGAGGIKTGAQSTVTVEESQIYGNSGDGMKTGSESTATVKESQIYGNSGDGIETGTESTVTISNNKIYGNSSRGILAYDCNGTIQNNLIYDNWIGILSVFDTVATVRGNTIVGSGYGGIVAAGNSSLTIYNCILWDNVTYDLYGCNATYSCIEDCNEADGTGNICGDANDPCFINAANDDYHLKSDSPCIDAGKPNWSYYGQVDIDGEPRVIGLYVDIGADETDYHSVERLSEFIWPTVYPNAHWWPLDATTEGATAYDSVGDSNGTFNGNDPCWVDGFNDGAVDFNGVNDYFAMPDLDNAYGNSDTFTVVGWFKTNQSTGMQTVVGQWSQCWEAGQEYYGWQVLVYNNKVVARFGYAIEIPDVTGTTDVNDGEWHQFAMVRNGTSTALYVDGQPEDSDTVTFYVYNTKFRVGDGSYKFNGNPALKGGPFNGMIDDVMIFDRVLSSGEVEELYENGVPD